MRYKLKIRKVSSVLVSVVDLQRTRLVPLDGSRQESSLPWLFSWAIGNPAFAQGDVYPNLHSRGQFKPRYERHDAPRAVSSWHNLDSRGNPARWDPRLSRFPWLTRRSTPTDGGDASFDLSVYVSGYLAISGYNDLWGVSHAGVGQRHFLGRPAHDNRHEKCPRVTSRRALICTALQCI